MTDDMDDDDATVLTVDDSKAPMPDGDVLKRRVSLWAKRWTLGMALAFAVPVLTDYARWLPYVAATFALASLLGVVIGHEITIRKWKREQ